MDGSRTIAAAYMRGMGNFITTDHPRVGDGKFTDKAHSEPEAALADDATVPHTGTESEWDAKYTEVESPNLSWLWMERELSDTALNHIWTVLDVDGDQFIAPGKHFVNRAGYLVTEQPWSDLNEDYKLDSVDSNGD